MVAQQKSSMEKRGWEQEEPTELPERGARMRTAGEPHRKIAGKRGLLYPENEFGINPGSTIGKRSNMTSL